MVWVTTFQGQGYGTPRLTSFNGGILVKDPERNGVFLTQPIKHYLTEALGIEGE